jgi:hypothetical protein
MLLRRASGAIIKRRRMSGWLNFIDGGFWIQ